MLIMVCRELMMKDCKLGGSECNVGSRGELCGRDEVR
jgi:hypothetical protein